MDYVAEQVGVPAEEFSQYSWRSRSAEYHRAQIRSAFGFREFSRGDEDTFAAWLAEEVWPVELGHERLREAVLVRCRAEGIEPPGRLDRIVGSARSTFEQPFCQRTTQRLSEQCVAALEGLVAEQDAGRGLLAELKVDPGVGGWRLCWPRSTRSRRYAGSACRTVCSPTGRRSWWTPGGPGRCVPTRPICGPANPRCG